MQPQAAATTIELAGVSLTLAPVGSSSFSSQSKVAAPQEEGLLAVAAETETETGYKSSSSSSSTILDQPIVDPQTEAAAARLLGAATSGSGGDRRLRLAGRSNSCVFADAGPDSCRVASRRASSLWSLPSSSRGSRSSSSSSSSSLSTTSISRPCLLARCSSSSWMMAGDPLGCIGGDNKSKSEGIGSSSSTQSYADASEINIAHSARPTISCRSSSSSSSPEGTNDNNINYNDNDNDRNANANNNNNDDEIGSSGSMSTSDGRLWCANGEEKRATPDCCNRRQNGSDSNQFNTCHYHRQRPCLLMGEPCRRRRRRRHEHSLVCAKRRRLQGGQIITPARSAPEPPVAVASGNAEANAVALAPTTINNAHSRQQQQQQQRRLTGCPSQMRCCQQRQQQATTARTIEHHRAGLPYLDHYDYYDTKTLSSSCDAPLTSCKGIDDNEDAQDDNNNNYGAQDATNSGGTSSRANQQPASKQTSPSVAIIETREAQKRAYEQPPAGRALASANQKQHPNSSLINNKLSRHNQLHSSGSNRFNATATGASEQIVSLWQLLSLQHHSSCNNLKRTQAEAPDASQEVESESGGEFVIVFSATDSQNQQEPNQDDQNKNWKLNWLTSEPAMEILRQPTVSINNNNNDNNTNVNLVEDRLIAPKTYPNNTVLVDLSKCHRNITHLLPHPTQVSPSNKSLGSLWAGCWPPLLWRASASSSNRCHSIRGAKKRGAQFSYQIPESLLRTNVTLKQEDYDRALSVLSGDVRYQLHLLLYRRVQTIWMLLSTILCVLVPVLLANLETLMIVGACCLWLGLQIVGAFATTKFRKKLDQMLEKSVAQANSFFMEHNLMLGVINVGGLLSKAKLIIPMLYFDTSQCREQIESIISIDSRNDADGNSNKHILDYTRIDLPLTKPNIMALAQSQLAKKIVLRYSQRWISYFDKRKLMFNDDRIQPRHLSTGKCLCQFIEEHFRNNVNPKQQQEKHNHLKQTGKLKAPHTTIQVTNNGPDQQPEEAPVKPQVIRKTTQMAPTIPTLSRMVSLKESHPDHVKIDLSGYGQLAQKNKQPGHGGQLAPHPWCYMDSANNGEQQQQPVEPGKVAAGETPSASAGSPDLSLEIGGDLISRSDELVRKLRLLLELRKNELQGIDGSLFSGVLYKTPQSFSVLDPTANDDGRPNGGAQNDPSIRFEAKVEDNNNQQRQHHTQKANEGKRFYTQREGLFFLGSNGAKRKIHQDTTNRTNHHVLEIC